MSWPRSSGATRPGSPTSYTQRVLVCPRCGEENPERFRLCGMCGAPLAADAAPAHEERKVVTVLFADLVGSTRLGERLDPEEVRLVVGEAINRIVGEVQALGGHVKDLAGDGVLAFFGAPVAHEDDAERAVRAALAIVDAVRAYGGEVAAAFGSTR